jgi:hypothetical protein
MVLGVAADLEEGGVPLRVDHIEVVVIHADRSPAAAEVHRSTSDLFRHGSGLASSWAIPTQTTPRRCWSISTSGGIINRGAGKEETCGECRLSTLM